MTQWNTTTLTALGRSASTSNQTIHYNQFMESQRNMNTSMQQTRQWQNRPRTYSNERFGRSGGNFRNNNFQGRGPISDRHSAHQNNSPSPQKTGKHFIVPRSVRQYYIPSLTLVRANFPTKATHPDPRRATVHESPSRWPKWILKRWKSRSWITNFRQGPLSLPFRK